MRFMRVSTAGSSAPARINPRHVLGLYAPAYSTTEAPVTCVTTIAGAESDWHVEGTVAEIEAEWHAAMKEEP